MIFLFPYLLQGQDKAQPGKFIVEPPTLENLGFEWYISGDDNRNAVVSVDYRIAGSGKEWKEGMPLLRIGGERLGDRGGIDYTTLDMFAGSVLNLTVNTKYECRFTMEDPDGVQGKAVKTVKINTREVPKAESGGRVRHVYPKYWDGGKKKQPAYTGLLDAYRGTTKRDLDIHNSANTDADWAFLDENPVKPGDIIKIHGGLYKADRLDYVNPSGIPFDGTYFLTAEGTPEHPIVIKAAGDGEVIFDGAGTHNFFNVMATKYNIFKGITFRNADRIFMAGRKHITGASGLTIKNCRFENVGEAVRTQFAGSKNFYIADNVIIGRDDRYRLFGWASGSFGKKDPYGAHPLHSYIAIKVYGSGHVIAHNSIAYFHDAIDVATYGTPEKKQELKPVSIDIYNNDIHLMADDCIESDGGAHNIRIMRNRCVNSAEQGFSGQPVFGGPTYLIRNILYQMPGGNAFKFFQQPAGFKVYQNTIIADHSSGQTYSNAHFRNNLFLSNDQPGPILTLPFATAYSTSDYNGYRPNRGSESTKYQYEVISPANGKRRDYSLTDEDIQKFKILESLSEATGFEQHSIEVSYDIFKDLQKPDPNKPHKVYHATDLDFTLKPKGKAVDKGVRIPNVNDDFTGKSPDLGALETDTPVPVYGARQLDPNHAFYR